MIVGVGGSEAELCDCVNDSGRDGAVSTLRSDCPELRFELASEFHCCDGFLVGVCCSCSMLFALAEAIGVSELSSRGRFSPAETGCIEAGLDMFGVLGSE